MGKIKLFCFPYAGGFAANYLKWKKHLNTSITLIPIEFAGRGARFKENPYNSIQEAVEDIFQMIKPQLNSERFAFFGHSMGGLIAYELAQKLTEGRYSNPTSIFFSGCEFPGANKKLNFDVLEDAIAQFASNFEFDLNLLKDMILPALRSDIKILNQYNYKEKGKLNCNFTVINGRDDINIDMTNIKKWQHLTCKDCAFKVVDGNHMFIESNTLEVVKIINDTLFLI